uniref:Somatostatin/Cortistatin C-terminal domain-containing protein n=1 Tax=Pygocentrus nattereri TaxID=42514 RepID=A0A3B4D7X6_PYGNA
TIYKGRFCCILPIFFFLSISSAQHAAVYYKCPSYFLLFLPLLVQELSRMLILKLLSDLEIPGDNEVLSGTDVRSDMVRQLPFPQRERKTGCRNFFWKTFTSC